MRGATRRERAGDHDDLVTTNRAVGTVRPGRGGRGDPGPAVRGRAVPQHVEWPGGGRRPARIDDRAAGRNSGPGRRVPRTSSIKFRVLDPVLGGSPNAEVLAVESASADVSFADLITGRANPNELHLHGVSLALRADPSGKVLTTLPTLPGNTSGEGKVPLVTVENGRVAVRKEVPGVRPVRADPAGRAGRRQGGTDRHRGRPGGPGASGRSPARWTRSRRPAGSISPPTTPR